MRLICDREREILAFVPVEYWSIMATLTPKDKEHLFEAKLLSRKGEKLEIHNQREADELLRALEGRRLPGQEHQEERKEAQSRAPVHHQHPPAGSLPQARFRRAPHDDGRPAALRRHRARPGRIRRPDHLYANRLHPRRQGSPGRGPRLLSPRTSARGSRPDKPRQVTRKGAQDAHEAIRPTSVFRHPDEIKRYLSGDQYRLYRLIWQRFMASQMSPAVFDVVSVDIEAKDMLFRATGSTVKFQGFMKVYTEGKDDDKVVADEEQPPLPPSQRRRTARPQEAHCPSSTSPSRRPASPRPPSSVPSKKKASAGRALTRRSYPPSRTASTWKFARRSSTRPNSGS